MDEESLFSHLEQLLADLPLMQQKSARLERANAAQGIVAAQRNVQTCQAMLDYMDGELASQRDALKAATATGDAQAIDQAEHGIVYFSQQRGYRIAPAENARRALDDLLAQSMFATVDEAMGAAMSDGDRAALAHEIETYRSDYDATFAACKQIEDGE